MIRVKNGEHIGNGVYLEGYSMREFLRECRKEGFRRTMRVLRFALYRRDALQYLASWSRVYRTEQP